MSARIVAVANQKGGVGKTTTAVNLAGSVAAAEKRVLLVDMDAQGNASSGCGVGNIQTGDAQIYHALLQEKSPRELIRKTDLQYLDVLPAGADLIGFEVEAIEFENREFRLRNALREIENDYDHIFIDCPPSLSLLTINAFCAAHGLLVPLQCEYFALEGLGRLMETLDLIRAELNPTLQLDGILLTMFDRRNNLSHQVAREVEEHFGEKVFETRIPRNVKLSEAPSFGKPVLLYDIRSLGAQRYLTMAEEFLQKISKTSTLNREATVHQELMQER